MKLNISILYLVHEIFYRDSGFMREFGEICGRFPIYAGNLALYAAKLGVYADLAVSNKISSLYGMYIFAKKIPKNWFSFPIYAAFPKIYAGISLIYAPIFEFMRQNRKFMRI